MKEKNPWPTPVTVIIIVIGVIAIVALVTVAVLQNKPVHQKYKVKVLKCSGLCWEPTVLDQNFKSKKKICKPNNVPYHYDLSLCNWLYKLTTKYGQRILAKTLKSALLLQMKAQVSVTQLITWPSVVKYCPSANSHAPVP